MNMIRTETATITDTYYVQKITHNKYHPQFFYNNSYSFTTIFSLYQYTTNIPLSGEIIST